MSSNADIVKWFDEDAIRILEGDAEPRMRSGALAAMLGYSRHQSIAELIERHRPYLTELANLLTVRKSSGSGPEWEEYWCTESQCIYVAAKSDMEVANKITVMVVKQFDMYRKGLLVANGEPIARIIREEFQGVGSLLHDLTDLLKHGLTELRFLAKEIHGTVTFCAEELRGHRKEFSEPVLRAHRYMITLKFNSECPICRHRKIVEHDAFTNAAAHHHVARNNARFEATIVVCTDCHKRYHEPDAIEFRAQFHHAFNYYQYVATGIDLTRKPPKPCAAEQLDLLDHDKVQ